MGKCDYFGDTIGAKEESSVHGSQTLLHIVESCIKIMVAYFISDFIRDWVIA